LQGCHGVGDIAIRDVFRACIKLTHVGLPECVTNESLRILLVDRWKETKHPFRSIQMLCIAGAVKVNDDLFSYLENHTYLTALDISRCSNLSESALSIFLK